MELSIIIINWNAKEFLKGCLESIAASELDAHYEVLLVDNNSSDGSVDFIREHYPDVRLIASRENLGFAGGNNLAIKAAAGKYILLLNPDTSIEPDTLRIMLTFMEEHSECGVAGCKVLNPDGTLQLACRRNIPGPMDGLYKLAGLSRLFPRSPVFSRYNLTYLPENQISLVDAVSGSFLLIRREVVDKIGLLDGRFFMHGEDLDWCLRAQRAGYMNYYVPHTSIIHYHGQSRKKRPFKSTWYFYRAMYLFYRKHNNSLLGKLVIGSGIGISLLFALVRTAAAFLFRRR